MDRDELLKRLAAAETAAQQDRLRIRDQKRAIASLMAARSDACHAEQDLQAFERAQDIHLAEIERIKDALCNIQLVRKPAQS
jgi:hypothetical protein